MSLCARFVIVALPFLAVSTLRAGDFDLKFRPMPDGSEIRDVLIPTFDGLYVYGSIRKPAGTGPFAGVILIHGGTGGSRQATRGTLTQEGRLPAPVLIQAGYCLLSVDYRSRWVDEVQDILSGYRYFKKLPYVDEDAIGILGGSHGGRLTVEALTHIQPQAAVPCAGFFSLERLVRHIQGQGNAAMTSPLADGTPRPGAAFFKFMIRLLGGTPDEVPEAYERYNLLRSIDKIQTPLFVVHGQKDMLSPIDSSRELVAELKKLGKSVKTYYPENGPHGFYWGQSFQPDKEPIYDPGETEAFLKRTLEFFGEHLGDPSDDASSRTNRRRAVVK